MAEYAQDYLDSVSVYEDLFESGYLYVLNNLSGAVDQVFLTFDFPEHIREIVTDLTDLYIAALEIRIEENTWLSGPGLIIMYCRSESFLKSIFIDYTFKFLK